MSREFAWHETKRLENIRKHGIDFAELPDVWDSRVEQGTSDRDGENRWIALMGVRDSVVAVIYTMRNGTIRIISARKARDNERKAYRNLHRQA